MPYKWKIFFFKKTGALLWVAQKQTILSKAIKTKIEERFKVQIV